MSPSGFRPGDEGDVPEWVAPHLHAQRRAMAEHDSFSRWAAVLLGVFLVVLVALLIVGLS